MKRWLVGCVAWWSLSAHAMPDGLSLGWGAWRPLGVTMQRVGLQWHWQPFVWRPTWAVGGYWEASVGRWSTSHAKSEPGDARRLTAWSWSPVFRFEARHVAVELGVGAALLSRNRLAGRRLTTHGHFEDRLGIGWMWGADHAMQLGYRYFHYSNARWALPNQGLDTHAIVWIYRF